MAYLRIMRQQHDLPGLPPPGAVCRTGTLSTTDGMLVAEWPFPTAAAMGSSIRIKGIHRETKMALPHATRTFLSFEQDVFRLAVPEDDAERFAEGVRLVESVLERASEIPVLPSEVEEILTIGSRERLKWTKDGRLASAGTRTVKMRGRARSVTFHVHDPRHVEDVLDRDLPTIWRDEDKAEASENRKRAAGRAAAARAAKAAGTLPEKKKPRRKSAADAFADLDGWDAFAAAGLLA